VYVFLELNGNNKLITHSSCVDVVATVQCVTIVDTYGDLLIHLIATEYTPEEACKVHAFFSRFHFGIPCNIVTVVKCSCWPERHGTTTATPFFQNFGSGIKDEARPLVSVIFFSFLLFIDTDSSASGRHPTHKNPFQ